MTKRNNLENNVKGYFTGKKVTIPNGTTYTIGKISGWHGTGEPVYRTILNGKKVGELGNNFIKKYRKNMRKK